MWLKKSKHNSFQVQSAVGINTPRYIKDRKDCIARERYICTLSIRDNSGTQRVSTQRWPLGAARLAANQRIHRPNRNSATELESSCKLIYIQAAAAWTLRATWRWLTVNEQGYWHSVVFLFHRRRHKNQMHVRIARSTDKNQTRKSHDRCCRQRTCQQQSTITPFCWKAFEVLEVLPTCHQRVNQCKWENHRTVKIRHHAFF